MDNERSLIGRLEIEPIRTAFRREDRDFTTWLAEHVEVLGERLGMELSLIQREKAVGAFNVDLMCEGSDGRAVIVENQLEPSDHDHLGKLLTYLVNLDAAAAVWVTSDPRPEHQKVIDWLNESTPADITFYMVKAEAVRVGDSLRAPLFTIVAGPSPQIKETGHEKKEWAERHVKRMEFWKSLLERSKAKTPLFSNISPSRQNWISTGAGKSGVSFNYVILMDSAVVELYIDYDQTTGEGNKAMFDAFHAQKNEIEAEYQAPIEWQRLDDKRACRIMGRVADRGLTDGDNWPKTQDQMIDAMIRLHAALRPRFDDIRT